MTPYDFKADHDKEEKENKKFFDWITKTNEPVDTMICCVCNQEDVDHDRVCYECEQKTCEKHYEVCKACEETFCWNHYQDGGFIDMCNDCYAKEYDPDYPDPGLECWEH
jgi:hypothetical protein